MAPDIERMHQNGGANLKVSGEVAIIKWQQDDCVTNNQEEAVEDDNKEVCLKRTVTLWNGVSIILGVMIGSGIFVSPRGVLEETGSIGGSLIVWSLCGLLALLGALCFAELGTSISKSGGEYTYIKLAYGNLTSFLYLWVLVIIILPCSNAIASLTFAKYTLQPLYNGCEPPETSVRLLALALLLLLAYINCASSNKMADNSLKSSEKVFSQTQTSLPHLAKAFYATFYTYSGWNSLNTVTEEIQNPTRNIPRAIIISLSSITLIYILTNLAYFAVLTKAEILSSDAIAVLFGQKALPLLVANWLMPILVAISTMGGLNGSIFASSRILFAGARDGLLFEPLSTIHINYLTPIPAIIFLTLISCLYLTTTKILALINYMTFIEATFATLGVSTLLILRFKMPNIQRPLKVFSIIPIIYLAFSILLIILPLWTSPFDALIGGSILSLGIPIYYLTAGWQNKPNCYCLAIKKFNLICQKLTNCVTPSKTDQQQ